jgi:Tfp pilus assembly protein PilN
MGAFLSRFWLDAQNSDLKNSIKIKAAQITAQADLEKRFRIVQSKLNVYSQISNSQDTSKKVEGIVSKLPPNITLSSISLSADSAQIKGLSGSDVDIAQFVANLGTDKSFKNIELGQVSSSETGSVGTVFSVNVSF